MDPRKEHRAQFWGSIRAHVRARRATACSFGVTPVSFANASKRRRAQELCDIFGDVRLFWGIGERHVFERSYPPFPEDQARAMQALQSFVRDVSTCPPHVLAYAERLVAEGKRVRTEQEKRRASIDRPIPCPLCSAEGT